MKILVFGQLTDITHNAVLHADNVLSVQALREWLYLQYPALAQKQFVVAVNQHKAHDEQSLQPGDEIALLPPFSGG